MNDKPIIMQGWGVRATLEGRKTQTRRVATPQPGISRDPHGTKMPEIPDPSPWPCPHGQPGDLLWCRETWGVFHDGMGSPDESEFIVYRADDDRPEPSRWRPSIHMPRWASRLTLLIEDVRVERVQDIKDWDALAEGIKPADVAARGWKDATVAFRYLWNSINAARGYGWDANPWVWVIEYRAIHANVDDVKANPERYGIGEAA